MQLTVVPFFPDGQCAVITSADRRHALPHGEIEPGEDLAVDASLRVLLETAGFRRQTFHEFARSGDEVLAWCEGDVYGGNRPHARVPLTIDKPDALVRRLRDARADTVADVVEAAAHSYRTVDRAAFEAEQRANLERLYLAALTDEGGSGFGGTPDEWRSAREPITDGIDRDGTFLDLGCANGLLMESVAAWCSERGIAIEPYGVDVGEGLVALARTRLPEWADRIWLGDAAEWAHAEGMRFGFVHTLLDCVPRAEAPDLVAHLLAHVVRSGGRLLVSAYIAETEHDRTAGDRLRDMGYRVVGESRPRLDRPATPPQTAWIDAP